VTAYEAKLCASKANARKLIEAFKTAKRAKDMHVDALEVAETAHAEVREQHRTRAKMARSSAPDRLEMARAMADYTGHSDVGTSIYALTRHDGDMLAATEWMLRLGLGTRSLEAARSVLSSGAPAWTSTTRAVASVSDAAMNRTPPSAIRSASASHTAFHSDAMAALEVELRDRTRIRVLERDAAELAPRKSTSESDAPNALHLRAELDLLRHQLELSASSARGTAQDASQGESVATRVVLALLAKVKDLRVELASAQHAEAAARDAAAAASHRDALERDATAQCAALELRGDVASLRGELASARRAEAVALRALIAYNTEDDSASVTESTPSLAALRRGAVAAVAAAAARRRAARATSAAAAGARRRADAALSGRAPADLAAIAALDGHTLASLPPPAKRVERRSDAWPATHVQPTARLAPESGAPLSPVLAAPPHLPLLRPSSPRTPLPRAPPRPPPRPTAPPAHVPAELPAVASVEPRAESPAVLPPVAPPVFSKVEPPVAPPVELLIAPPRLATVLARLEAMYARSGGGGIARLVEYLAGYANADGVLSPCALERGLCAAAGVSLDPSLATEAETRCAWTKRLCAAFDADHDGTLSARELRVGLTALIKTPAIPRSATSPVDTAAGDVGSNTKGESHASSADAAGERDLLCRSTFELYDSDGSGSISFDEFAAQLARSLRMAQLLHEMERSSDGEPLAATATFSSASGGAIDDTGAMAQAMAASAFDAFDADHSGSINFNEFAAWFALNLVATE
jgi:Ca2+-binding EF-hand superfamily protein